MSAGVPATGGGGCGVAVVACLAHASEVFDLVWVCDAFGYQLLTCLRVVVGDCAGSVAVGAVVGAGVAVACADGVAVQGGCACGVPSFAAVSALRCCASVPVGLAASLLFVFGARSWFVNELGASGLCAWGWGRDWHGVLSQWIMLAGCGRSLRCRRCRVNRVLRFAVDDGVGDYQEAGPWQSRRSC